MVTDYTNVNIENTNVRVYVRARPPDDGSKPTNLQLVPEKPQQLHIKDPNNPQYGEHYFLYDGVFWTDADQATIFNTICKPQVHLFFSPQIILTGPGL